MTYLHSAHDTAHDPKHGGCEGLAQLMGISPAVLRNKVNIHNEHNHLRLDEAFKMMSITGNHAIIKAMAIQLGGVYVKMPPLAGEQEITCLETLTDIFMGAVAKHGATCAEFHARKADGALSKNDRKEIIKKAHDAIAELQKFIQLIGD